MAFRHPKLRVDFAPDCSHRAVAYYGQRGPQVHAWRKTCVGASLQIGPLIGEAHTGNGVGFNQRLGDWHARPDLHHARRCDLIADPLIELTERQHQAVVLLHEWWGVGQFEGIVL